MFKLDTILLNIGLCRKGRGCIYNFCRFNFIFQSGNGAIKWKFTKGNFNDFSCIIMFLEFKIGFRKKKIKQREFTKIVNSLFAQLNYSFVVSRIKFIAYIFDKSDRV